jgi:hypothetical protein
MPMNLPLGTFLGIAAVGVAIEDPRRWHGTGSFFSHGMTL